MNTIIVALSALLILGAMALSIELKERRQKRQQKQV